MIKQAANNSIEIKNNSNKNSFKAVMEHYHSIHI